MSEPPLDPLVCDTARMAALTARRPETIRHVCRDLRTPDGYDYAQCAAALDGAPDPLLLTAAQVCQYLNVKPGTIRQWVHRDELTAATRDDDGRPLYLFADLQRLHERMLAMQERMRLRNRRRVQLDL